MTEGVIKFQIEKWEESGPVDAAVYGEIEKARKRLYQMNFIGHNPEYNLGFGNISSRLNAGDFVITGSQTGHLENLDGSYYSIINGYNFENNSVCGRGPAKPSSESLSHAALYHSSAKINTVIHIHASRLWNRLYDTHPCYTPVNAEYGSIELYNSLTELMTGQKTSLPAVIVMRGHEDGIIIGAGSVDDGMAALDFILEKNSDI